MCSLQVRVTGRVGFGPRNEARGIYLRAWLGSAMQRDGDCRGDRLSSIACPTFITLYMVCPGNSNAERAVFEDELGNLKGG